MLEPGRRATGAARWPLHPRPRAWESLESYVRRLAGLYGVGFAPFCAEALGLDRGAAARLDHAPPRPALKRLSRGVGVPVADLESMTLARLWERGIDAAASLPAGGAAGEGGGGGWTR